MLKQFFTIIQALLFLILLSCKPKADSEEATVATQSMFSQSEVGYYQELSWSPDGTSLLVSILEIADNPEGFVYKVHRLNLDPPEIISLTPGPMDYWTSWSPDGSRIAYASQSGENMDVFVMDSDGSNRVRLTSESAADTQPAWSPDGLRIAFVSSRDGTEQILTMNADGTSQTRVGKAEGGAQTPSWSPDGSRIAYFETDGNGTDYVCVMKADGTGRTQIARGVWPSWSRDGARILYGGPEGLTTMNPNGSGKSILVEGDVEFGAYSPDGTRIAYIATENDSVTIYMMTSDGSIRRPLISRPAPAW